MRKLFSLAAVAVVSLSFQQAARADAGSYATAFINTGNQYLVAAFNTDPITDVTLAQSFQYAQYAQEAATQAQASGNRAYWQVTSQLCRTVYVYAYQDYQNTHNTYSLYAAVYYYYAYVYAYYASAGY